MLKMHPNRKNKIILSDYDYMKDIQNRLWMSQLSSFEVDALKEILDGSIKIPLSKLQSTLDADHNQLLQALEKFASVRLCKIENDVIHIDKEMRKYYEAQLTKFDEDFRPDMEFVQQLLKKLPMHVLLNWYAIPRTSDNIFQSLLEKYLTTPKVFLRFLAEANFNDPVLTGIIEDVFKAEDFTATASFLSEKYKLSKTAFEEYLLHLEFNFVCCLRYKKIEDKWVEVVAPFHEWAEYLRFLRDAKPKPLPHDSVELQKPKDFFIPELMTAVLKACLSAPLEVSNECQLSTPALKAVQKAFQSQTASKLSSSDIETYLPLCLRKLCATHLVIKKDDHLTPTSAAEKWLELPIEDRAITLHRHPHQFLKVNLDEPLYSQELCCEKNFRELERGLEGVAKAGWIFFDDFLKGLIAPIGTQEPISLKKKGRNWKYVLPEYTPQEKHYIESVIFQNFWETGMVEVGLFEGKKCFKVTPFGRMLLGVS